MNFTSVKTIISLVAGSVILTHSVFALAHNQAGSFPTGLAAAVDFYTVSCTDDGNGAPSYLEARVKDMTANSSKVNITIQKGTTNCNTNACARFSLDSADNDAGYSPLVKLTQGAGTYNLYVAHTAAGTDSYDVELHCKTATNVHTGTSTTSRQQQ